MSLPDNAGRGSWWPRGLATSGIVLAVLFAAGCTVQPVYGDRDNSVLTASGHTLGQELASISVEPVETREALEVRNHLIFLLGGGANGPVDKRYSLTLNVSMGQTTAARIQRRGTDEPTARIVRARGTYVLTSAETGAIVARGIQQMVASYDVPSQQFARLRAERDAQNRAARELAELIRLAIANDLANPSRALREQQDVPEDSDMAIFDEDERENDL
jgi:LPS-assembly lipoprotein